MSYRKAMKHWKNHRKDKYYQQCAPVTIPGIKSDMQDYKITTNDGTYIITAHCYEEAAQRIAAAGLSVIELNDKEIRI